MRSLGFLSFLVTAWALRLPEADDDVPADVILTEATCEDRRHSQKQKAAGRECACSEWQATKEESS